MSNELKGGDISQELSTDLNVITAEINAYQRVAGEAIFEIGRRLKYVKENDLVHGEFMEWYESNGMTKDFVSKAIRVTENLGDFETSRNIGLDALYQIATMPESPRTESHEIPSTGETKTPDEMTVRELREVKAELKKTQSQRDAERAERERLEVENEELADKPPEVIEKEVVKTEYIDNTPYDYETIKEELAQKQCEIDALSNRLADIPETKEHDRTLDKPYGVELGGDFYEAMRKLSEWQKEYAWIADDVEELRFMASMDINLKRDYDRVDGFWETLRTVFQDDGIIDIEFVNSK